MNRITIHNVNADTDREAWLALRRNDLSATDWPKIKGSSPWAGAGEVLADKRTIRIRPRAAATHAGNRVF